MEHGPLEIEWFSLKVWKMYFHDQAFRLAVFLQAEETRGSKLLNTILVLNYKTIYRYPGYPCQFSFENRFFEKESTSSEPAICWVPSRSCDKLRRLCFFLRWKSFGPITSLPVHPKPINSSPETVSNGPFVLICFWLPHWGNDSYHDSWLLMGSVFLHVDWSYWMLWGLLYLLLS